MKRKVYFQTNIMWQFLLFFLLAMSCDALTVFLLLLLKDYNDNFSSFLSKSLNDKIIYCLIMIFLIIGFIMFLYFFIQLEHYYILLRKDDVYAPDDWNRKTSVDKVQYATVAKYNDIKDIKMIKDIQNLKNANWIRSTKYIVIITNNNEEKKFFVGYFKKKSLIKIINDIKNRMRLVGNNVDLKDTEEIINNIENR